MPGRKGSLRSLLHPRAVAVVGASDNADKVGGRPLRHLIAHGFAGRLYPVTQRGAPVQGLPSYTSLAALPEAPDVAILCVPADRAGAEIEACVRLGVSHVLLFSSGFAEVGPAGSAQQQALAETCRRTGVRLLGPNTLGIANFSNGAVLSFASVYLDCPHQDGPVAIVSQSGGFGAAAYALLRANGVGVRYVCCTGNQADLDVADFVAELAHDESLRVLLIYLEEVKDAAAMRSALEAARNRGVALIAMLGGLSSQGARSAALHTGSTGFDGLSGAQIAALFREHGCRLATGLPDLCESVPLYLGPGGAASTGDIALISNSGASCVIAADAAAALGLPLATLSPASCATLDTVLPDFSLNRNPLDLTAMLLADSSLLGRVMNVVLADSAVAAAALGLVAVGGPSYDLPRFVRETADAVQASGKPCVVHAPDPRVRQAFAQKGLPVCASERAALEALRDWRSHLSLMAANSRAGALSHA
ncbi:MAG: CoA-binding protein [Steroidobacteraceae bacterium]|jgi:acyl-CoA synthetase (NDP forming)|nr:CoA-binding protein [Steroidobacteraceae bacterium]